MSGVTYYETLLQEDINVGVSTATKRNPGGGSLVGTQVGIHSVGVGQVAVTSTYDPASISSLGTVVTTVPYAGAAVGDFVLVSFSLVLGGVILAAEVSSTNNVTVTFFNPTTAAIDLSSGTIKILVLKSR